MNALIRQSLAVVTLLLSGHALANVLDFSATDNADRWLVSTHVGGADGEFASFNTSDFATATSIASRPGWIANNASGTNGGIGTWTFFVFRQTFDLSDLDPESVELLFRWAADDSGEVYSYRGSWVPKFRLNDGDLVPWGTGPTYNFGSVVSLTEGFVAGINTIDFFVEGNGVTDGFALTVLGATADPLVPGTVPLPATLSLVVVGLTLLSFKRQRPEKA